MKRNKIKFKNRYALEKWETNGVAKIINTSKTTAQEKVFVFTLANPFPYITIFNLNVVFLAKLHDLVKRSR